MKIDILADGLSFPEGPAFDATGTLWGVEVLGGSIFRHDSTGFTRHAVGGRPNAIAFWGDTAWLCDSGRNAVRTWVGNPQVARDDRGGFDMPNDLAFDPAGNLVFTCPGSSRTEPTGNIWCRAADGRYMQVADGMFFPNGLAFSADATTLVVAETYRHRLWRGGWDSAECRWIDPKPWVSVGGPIGPDGMAFASDGLLYVAVFDTGLVRVVDAAGEIVRDIPVPGARPTNVAFDPSGRLGLVVTEAERGLLLSLPDLADPGCLVRGPRR